MAEIGLPRSFELLDGCLNNNKLIVPGNCYTPGFWVVLCALAKRLRIARGGVAFLEDENRSLAEAIGVSRAIWGKGLKYDQKGGKGKTFSRVEHLCSSESTDSATTGINGCLRKFFTGTPYESFCDIMCDVVGDLHDNVWSHGKSSGFSMAQMWKGISNDQNRVPPAWHKLEFALADAGLGFLGELTRTDMDVRRTDAEAIRWCIQEGNSTKKNRPGEDWAQRVPGDVINNPFRGIEKTKISENHHQGLGLFKLICTIKRFKGELWIASGRKIFFMDSQGAENFQTLETPWQGVAIACQFDTRRFPSTPVEELIDPDIDQIMQALRTIP